MTEELHSQQRIHTGYPQNTPLNKDIMEIKILYTTSWNSLLNKVCSPSLYSTNVSDKQHMFAAVPQIKDSRVMSMELRVKSMSSIWLFSSQLALIVLFSNAKQNTRSGSCETKSRQLSSPVTTAKLHFPYPPPQQRSHSSP